MDLFNSRDKINIIFILSLISIIFYGTSGWALDPTITDVTTRSFSVVWTEGAAINPDSHSCSLTVKKGGSSIDNSQIIRPELDAEGQPNEEGRLGLARGVVKFEVIELDPDSAYTVNGKESNGSTSLFTNDQTVVTEKFKGLSSYADANDNDIVTNDIFHWPVYDAPPNPGDTPKTPALGAMVMAEIYGDAGCIATKLSDYPITGWVGAGMPGNTTKQDYINAEFDQNNICYKEFAALNFNNLFDQNNYPLQLTGSEYIKIEVISGIDSVASGTDYKIPLPEITMVNSQKISSAKASQKLDLKVGPNTFAYPFEPPQGYTLGNFIQTIFNAGGLPKYAIYWDGGWQEVGVTYYPPPYDFISISGESADEDIVAGRGYLIYMSEPLEQDLYISSSPTPKDLVLYAGMNVVSFPQVANFYKIKDLIWAIINAGGLPKYIITWDGGWQEVGVQYYPPPYDFYSISGDSQDMFVKRDSAYQIYMITTPENPMLIDPLI